MPNPEHLLIMAEARRGGRRMRVANRVGKRAEDRWTGQDRERGENKLELKLERRLCLMEYAKDQLKVEK